MPLCQYRPGFLLIILLVSFRLHAQTPASLTLHPDETGVPVSPELYGLMTEEINFSYDGGIYGELIRNRAFKDSSRTAAFWSLMQGAGSQGVIDLDKTNPLSAALPVSLRLDVRTKGDKIGVANTGYWGIPVKPGTTYQGSLYARIAGGGGPLNVSLESADGKIIYAAASITGVNSGWKRYTFTLSTPANCKPGTDARFVISAREEGSYYFNLVSLFAPTYKDRANGNRTDIMQLLADMKPAFLRFPGGNYLEGNTFSQRFDWKKTIGPLEQRAGHLSPWHYRSTDGMGLLEFLEWCEDLHMQPLLAVFAGYVLNRDYLEAGPFLQPFVDDALDEIEYVTGDSNTKWGAQRAKDGHPAPFPLKYVEIGNEDGFDISGSYEKRYIQFYDAIKAKYPQLQIISTVGGKDGLGGRFPAPAGKTEIVDEHYYRNAEQMEENAHQYDQYDRNGPKVFVGEWATREGSPTTNMNAALGDAAWMTGMERNSDLVIMSCYAPLFVNVNPGGMQWKSDLIGYDAGNSYGSPSYYAQKLFSTHIGNRVIKITAENCPTQPKKPDARDSITGAQPKMIDALFYSATTDTTNGKIFLKMVNTQSTPQTVAITIQGAGNLFPKGTKWILSANSPTETNSISEPTKIVPVMSLLKGLSGHFEEVLPPYSITVLQLERK
jgi:alpha-N-arabinofuranosidase